MKWQQLTEDANLDESNVWEFIQKNCQPYLSENPDWIKYPLFRGMNEKAPITINVIRTNRGPKDSSPFYHNLYNKAFASKGIQTNRSNSVFCSGDPYQAEDYGDLYVIFPIGNFNYAYSPEIHDLAEYSGNFMANGAFKFKNEAKPVLTPDDVTGPFFNDVQKELPEKFSLSELNNILKKHRLTFSQIIRYHLPNKVEDIFKRLGFNNKIFYEFFSSLYKTTNFDEAIRSEHEIMISGKSYLAIRDELYIRAVKNWK